MASQMKIKHLEQAIEDLLEAVANKVILVHYAQIERIFLKRACWHSTSDFLL
jgi:DNA polymerase III epsilon subunit-like protein